MMSNDVFLKQLTWCLHTKKTIEIFKVDSLDAFLELDKALSGIEDKVILDLLITVFTDKEEVKKAYQDLEEYINVVAIKSMNEKISLISQALDLGKNKE